MRESFSRKQGTGIGLVVLFLAQAGCFASGGGVPSIPADVQPIGTLELVSPSQGRHTLAPTTCASGERQLFLGVDFDDPRAGFTARLLVEPTGLAFLRIFPTSRPLDQGVLFARADCKVFDLSLDRTGWRVNDIYDLSATVEVDCRNGSGDSIQGRLSVGHCH